MVDSRMFFRTGWNQLIPDANLLAESSGQATQTTFIRHCIFDVLQTVCSLALAKTYDYMHA